MAVLFQSDFVAYTGFMNTFIHTVYAYACDGYEQSEE